MSHSRSPLIHRHMKFRSHTPTGTSTDSQTVTFATFWEVSMIVEVFSDVTPCQPVILIDVSENIMLSYSWSSGRSGDFSEMYIWFAQNTLPAEAPISRVCNMFHWMSTSSTIPFSLKWRCRFVRCRCYDIAFTVHTYCSVILLISFTSHLLGRICLQ